MLAFKFTQDAKGKGDGKGEGKKNHYLLMFHGFYNGQL